MKMIIDNEVVVGGVIDTQHLQDHPETDEITLSLVSGEFITFNADDVATIRRAAAASKVPAIILATNDAWDDPEDEEEES